MLRMQLKDLSVRIGTYPEKIKFEIDNTVGFVLDDGMIDDRAEMDKFESKYEDYKLEDFDIDFDAREIFVRLSKIENND